MPTSIGNALVVVGILFPITATLAVGLRFRARALKNVSLALDDWIIIPGLIFAYIENFVVVYGVLNGGFGKPDDQIQGKTRKLLFGKVLLVVTISETLGISMTKISVLLLYKRIFIIRRFTLAVYGLISVTLVWMIGTAFAGIFAWSPISAEWTRQGHNNINYPTFLIVTGVLSMVLGLITLSYPLFVIPTLNMTRRKKFIVAGIFLLGLLCLVAGITKLPYRIQYLQAVGSLPGGEKNSLNLDLVSKVTIWGILEMSLAVIAACLPTYAPLLHDPLLESVIHSARSAMSLRSCTSGDSGSKTDHGESSEAKHAWQALHGKHHDTLIEHSNTAERSIDNIDMVEDVELGIRVNHKFGVTDHQ